MPDRLVRRLNGARGSALLSIGWLSVGHGLAYLPVDGPPSQLPTGLQAIGSVLPLSFYASLWITVGVVATAGAFTDRHGYPRPWDQWGFYGFTGVVLLWAFAYFIGWWMAFLPGGDEPNRQWVSAWVYLGVAGLGGAAMRMRNRFIIDLRDFVIDLRGDT